MLLQEAPRYFRQVVTEGVVRRQRVPFLSLYQIIAQQITADTFHIHRIRGLDVEHVLIATRPAQRVRIAAGVNEHGLHPVRYLADGEAGCRRDFANNHCNLVALDQALGLGGGRLRVDRILHHQFDLAPHHAPRRVDLFRRKLDAHNGIFAERTEEAGERRQVTDANGVGLRRYDGRHADPGDERGTGRVLEKRPA